MIQRLSNNLGVYEGEAPPETRQLEVDGYAVIRGVFTADDVQALRREIDSVFASYPPERGRTDEFRYEMFNRSALAQAALAHPRILAVIEPLLGNDCHVLANTALRNSPAFGGGRLHFDSRLPIPLLLWLLAA